jgi:Ca2+-binding EF-hand superfamily protein
MGFYPTQKEIENMQNEIRFSKYIDNYKETLSELDLDMFLKLFVNNRPVYGISKNHIVNALSILGNVKGDGSPYITREELFKILTTEGEKMGEDEIREC